MLKDHITCESPKCWICRLLFLVFLAIFAQSPIADAYTDSLCSNIVFLDVQNLPDDPVVTDELNLNDDLTSNQESKASDNFFGQQQQALLRDSIKYGSADRTETIQNSAYDIKSSQICPPVSSDLPPPVI